ncbi:protopanaxadiol 6-hydroxylase [Quercus suber]|uniref:Protopanaxadiol 6-hydroxylase n=1 Tax=Quercus suber TaxID=58331 RepID=A0AAW0JPX7_QUESU
MQKSTRDKLPPSEKGWPIIGETLEFAGIGQKGTPKMFVMEKMRKYSQDLFKTSMFRENMVDTSFYSQMRKNVSSLGSHIPWIKLHFLLNLLKTLSPKILSKCPTL